MTKLIKTILVALALVLSQASFAEIIELDPEVGDLCRQQLLLHSKKEEPLFVLSYVKDSPETLSFMNIYKEVANKHPELTFFTLQYTYLDDAMTRENTAVCLRQLGSIGEADNQRATVWMFYRIFDNETGRPYLLGPLRVGPNKKTKESLEEFITIPPGHSFSKNLSFKSDKFLSKDRGQ